MHACVRVCVCTFCTHQMLSLSYYFKSCERNNRHTDNSCYNAHLRVVPMAFVVHFMLLVFLFKLAIIDENSSIALNICSRSTLRHYVCMYLFVHLFACLLACSLVRSYIHSFGSVYRLIHIRCILRRKSTPSQAKF